MVSVRRSLALILLALMLPSATPIEQCTEGGPPGKINTVKKSLDGVVLFQATISPESRAGEPVSLSLQLKNLGTELLVFNDSPLNTVLLKVRTKDGALVPKTRYLEDLVKPANKGGARDVARDVDIELAPAKEAGVTLPLHRFFDLSLHGDYVVSVEARFTVKGTVGKIAIENLPFTIRHVPFGRITNVK
jgi:hypothetical protein